jgi:hypothetical protein
VVFDGYEDALWQAMLLVDKKTALPQ